MTKISTIHLFVVLSVFVPVSSDFQMKKGNKDPNPIVQIAVQDVTRDSRVRRTPAICIPCDPLFSLTHFPSSRFAGIQ